MGGPLVPSCPDRRDHELGVCGGSHEHARLAGPRRPRPSPDRPPDGPTRRHRGPVPPGGVRALDARRARRSAALLEVHLVRTRREQGAARGRRDRALLPPRSRPGGATHRRRDRRPRPDRQLPHRRGRGTGRRVPGILPRSCIIRSGPRSLRAQHSHRGRPHPLLRGRWRPRRRLPGGPRFLRRRSGGGDHGRHPAR